MKIQTTVNTINARSWRRSYKIQTTIFLQFLL